MAGDMAAWYIKPQVLVVATICAWCFSAAVCQVAPGEAYEIGDDILDTTEMETSTLTTRLPPATPDRYSCVEDLMPCQMYLHSKDEAISPSWCCDPLDMAMASDRECICSLSEINGSGLNITRDDFRRLLNVCSMDVDEADYCKGYINDTIADMPMKTSLQAAPMPSPVHVDLMSGSARTIYHLAKIELLIIGIFFFVGL